MNKQILLLLITITTGTLPVHSSSFIVHSSRDSASLQYSGQLSGWVQFAPDISLEGWTGGRYLPRLNYRIPFNNDRLLDVELSANIFGEAGLSPFDRFTTGGNVKPYRAWIRYSTDRLELRLGLQKINFGSARLLRPLMWFDRVDPRDPLQLTDGAWGLLYRRYFRDNANLWLWALHGNSGVKGWEALPVDRRYPEAGGRLQLPLPRGEIALSYHFRVAGATALPRPAAGEHRLGLDARLDAVVGLWIEASWSRLGGPRDAYTHQEMITLGTDYTLPAGNGLVLTLEQLLLARDKHAWRLDDPMILTALSLAYPIGLLDNLSAIAYRDWTRRDTYLLLDWQRQWNRLALHLLAYWNPSTYLLPGSDRLAGRGLQLMIVWNH